MRRLSSKTNSVASPARLLLPDCFSAVIVIARERCHHDTLADRKEETWSSSGQDLRAPSKQDFACLHRVGRKGKNGKKISRHGVLSAIVHGFTGGIAAAFSKALSFTLSLMGWAWPNVVTSGETARGVRSNWHAACL